MHRPRRSYSPEYRVEAAHRAIDAGRSVREVARELDLHENLLHKWVRDERRRMAAAGKTDRGGRESNDKGGQPLSDDERAELMLLRAKVTEQCAYFDVTWMAELLGVSTSGYYRFLQVRADPEPSPRLQRRRDLEVKNLAHHRASRGTYGSPRITADLRAERERVSKNTVAQVMADLGIEGISPRSFKTTTHVVANPDIEQRLVQVVHEHQRVAPIGEKHLPVRLGRPVVARRTQPPPAGDDLHSMQTPLPRAEESGLLLHRLRADHPAHRFGYTAFPLEQCQELRDQPGARSTVAGGGRCRIARGGIELVEIAFPINQRSILPPTADTSAETSGPQRD
ncbi:transposase [Nocardia otitidiscaviarum]